MSVEKTRIDVLLVEKGHCETRSQAQALILAGEITVNQQKIEKPGTLVANDSDIVLKEKLKYVGRGGLKLEKALEHYQIEVKNQVCMDVGSSTGGFTDCLLQAGAQKVYAIDVGYGQLDWRLRQDERVTVMERTHIRDVKLDDLQPSPTFCCIDVSFISLKKVLPGVQALLHAPAVGVALVKPQFEYKDYCQPKGFKGIVTQAEDLKTILTGLLSDLTSQLPQFHLIGLTDSPIKGAKGNREFLLAFSFEDLTNTARSDFDVEAFIEILDETL